MVSAGASVLAESKEVDGVDMLAEYGMSSGVILRSSMDCTVTARSAARRRRAGIHEGSSRSSEFHLAVIEDRVTGAVASGAARRTVTGRGVENRQATAGMAADMAWASAPAATWTSTTFSH